jgi:hypothetical protein
MKKYTCSICQSTVIGFEEDINAWKSGGAPTIALIKTKQYSEPHECDWQEVQVAASAIHGEAGFMTEGTMLDSINTIHDVESQKLADAATEREGKSYQQSVINK